MEDSTIFNMATGYLQEFQVGKPFEPGITNYPEGCNIDFSRIGLTVNIYVRDPTKEETNAIRNGNLKLAIVTFGHVLFICAKFGKMPWMESPFHVVLSQIRWLDGKGENRIPLGMKINIEEPIEGKGYRSIVFLIDAITGIIEVIREIGLDNTFSSMLRSYILWQNSLYQNEQRKFDMKEYELVIDRAFKIYKQNEMEDIADDIFELNRGKWRRINLTSNEDDEY